MKQPLHQMDTNLVFKYENKLSHKLVKNKPKAEEEDNFINIYTITRYIIRNNNNTMKKHTH